ncbi:MAG TPA: hypothetical protein VGX92_08620 [Pyrinomonadaceae bacterium]|nr:hypothetical protein [Pyrinomonadaceae bacterium]
MASDDCWRIEVGAALRRVVRARPLKRLAHWREKVRAPMVTSLNARS